MNSVKAAQVWLFDEKPSSEEIQESITNVCHLLAQPVASERRTELNAVLDLLVASIGGEKVEVIRPDQPVELVLDPSPLIPDLTPDTPPVSPQERRRLFEQLKASPLGAPF
jgi:hypothetical protein